MEIRLAQKLKTMRQKYRRTQDDLALFLGISPQAVSKWERSEGYPDITLLPRIAAYFHITVDELLGTDEIAKQERIDEITQEYNRIRQSFPLDKTYRLDDGIELIRKALNELPGVFFFEQLLAADLSYKAKGIADASERKRLFEESTALCEDILTRSTEDRWRDCAKQILLVNCAELGMTEKALETAYQLPNPYTTCEYMLTYILKDDELKRRQRLNAVTYYAIFRESVAALFEAGTSPEDMPHERELSVTGINGDEYTAAISNVIRHLK